MQKEQLILIADDISGWWESALVDCADGDIAHAEMLRGDPDSLRDLIGGKIFDECSGDKIGMLVVADIIKSDAEINGDKALEEAMEQFINDHE